MYVNITMHAAQYFIRLSYKFACTHRDTRHNLKCTNTYANAKYIYVCRRLVYLSV